MKIDVAVLSILVLLPAAAARAGCDAPVGLFASIESSVQVQRGGSGGWRAAALSDELCEGDTIRVGARSRAALQLVNDAVLRIDQNTTLRLVDIAGEKQERSVLELIEGAFQSFSRKPRLLSVNTPYLNGLIEGTEFLVRVEGDQSSLLVLEGRVRVENAQGSAVVEPGHAAQAGRGGAPVTTLVARPRDAVQWALHYPAVLPRQAGSVEQEIARIGGLPEADARLHAYRASLLLSVGRVDEARADVQRALALAPADGDALALQAVIAVARNERELALDSAGKATLAAPASAAPFIALSYAQQSVFDLDAALASVETAVRVEPRNALAWARLAELHASFGRLGESLEAAQQASSLDPSLSRTQSVLGFSYLMQVNTARARAAFAAAIALDQSDPMPRLGLGLARIADGELAAGRAELDVAASLDPNQSIIRSYLGKAYFEEKRAGLDEQQFGIARELDPRDPTPWFYDAIARQTSNRPGEALQALQKAIELNGNRAVYRSRLLLDSDLAARSASLARVFGDLGFEQLALVEGWKSVNTDPGNFSAHRFLADSYAALPRHEIARVSELLQSQLMQPLSMTPIQPHLAESDLFLVSAGGPGTLSFNEFNPLFQRDGSAVQASAMAGGNGTASAEAVLSGIGGKLAYSIGAFHYETDGFRPNADQDDDIFNAFVQAELSPDTSVQAEYRYRDAETGDLQLRFFPEEFFPGQRTPLETHSLRAGVRHAFSPGSVLLGSVIHSDADYGAYDEQPLVAPGFITFLGLEEPQQSTGGELQHLWRTDWFSLTTGGGYFDRSGESDFTLRTILPPPDDETRFPTIDADLQHGNLYGYLNARPHESLTLTLGLSGEYSDSPGGVDADDAYNPKFGLMWTPLRGTLLRAAAFKTSKRPVIANQTLEPTQVAGFNQFFDDFNQTEAWRYGAAIDQTFCSNLFAGAELSRRDQEVPASDQFGTPLTADWQDELARAYLFWLPHPWVGLKASYEFERIERDLELTDGLRKSHTARLPLGLTLSHPSGLGASFDATYVDQEGTFERLASGRLSSGIEKFWVLDAAFRYRLPGRHGFVSLGVTNLLDEDFRYFDTDYNNPRMQPERVLFGGVTLALP